MSQVCREQYTLGRVERVILCKYFVMSAIVNDGCGKVYCPSLRVVCVLYVCMYVILSVLWGVGICVIYPKFVYLPMYVLDTWMIIYLSTYHMCLL